MPQGFVCYITLLYAFAVFEREKNPEGKVWRPPEVFLCELKR